jgi:hypothetical protein
MGVYVLIGGMLGLPSVLNWQQALNAKSDPPGRGGGLMVALRARWLLIAWALMMALALLEMVLWA